jgi:hypothetical protein
MMIMPSLNQGSQFDIGPRDLIHSLAYVLASFRGGNPAVISILQDKLTTLGLAIGSPQKLLELSSPEEEYEDWHERSQSAQPAPSSFSASPHPAPSSPSAYRSNMSMDDRY